jgi:CheY-like chemotaxis protein
MDQVCANACPAVPPRAGAARVLLMRGCVCVCIVRCLPIAGTRFALVLPPPHLPAAASAAAASAELMQVARALSSDAPPAAAAAAPLRKDDPPTAGVTTTEHAEPVADAPQQGVGGTGQAAPRRGGRTARVAPEERYGAPAGAASAAAAAGQSTTRPESGGGGGAETDVAAAGAVRSPPQSPPQGDFAGARVLVVDDSEANRRFAGFLLRRLGCVVAAVSDGDEVELAVASADESGEPFDVVLMDLVMVRWGARGRGGGALCSYRCRVRTDAVFASPAARAAVDATHHTECACSCAQVRMNGDTALAGLRAEGWGVPVAAVTANATPEDVERYRAQGFAGVLAKPFTQAQVYDLLAILFKWG